MPNAPSRWRAPAITTGHRQLAGRIGPVTGAGRNIGDVDANATERAVERIRGDGGTATAALYLTSAESACVTG